jgi:sulfur carrier protein
MDVPEGSTVRQLLTRLNIDKRPVAVERNKSIVSHRIFDTAILVNGDVLEVVTLVGGG